MNGSFKLYHSLCVSISGKLRQITSTTLKTLKKNKVARIALGGDNLHQLQSAGVLETRDKNYYVHPECYKKLKTKENEKIY